MNDDHDLELDFHLEGDLEGDFAGDHERDMPGHYAAVVDADGRPVLDRVHGVVGARMRLDDWHALFAAVKTRLHGIATAPDLWARGPCDEQQPHPAAALVLECALALDSLHVQIRTGLAAEVPDMPSVQSPTSAQVQGVDAACAAGMDFARAPRLAG